MNIVVISIFLTVLWILSMALAVVGGRYSVREEIKEAAKPTFIQHLDTSQFEQKLEEAQQRIALLDQQVQAFNEKQQNAPVDISMGAQRRLEMIEPLSARVVAVEAAVADLLLRDQSYQDRFKRVERKSGMSV